MHQYFASQNTCTDPKKKYRDSYANNTLQEIIFESLHTSFTWFQVRINEDRSTIGKSCFTFSFAFHYVATSLILSCFFCNKSSQTSCFWGCRILYQQKLRWGVFPSEFQWPHVCSFFVDLLPVFFRQFFSTIFAARQYDSSIQTYCVFLVPLFWRLSDVRASTWSASK